MTDMTAINADDSEILKFEQVKYDYEIASDDESGEGNGVRLVHALTGATFDVKRGEFVAIIGRNGSGKSTAAKLMNAILLPSSGTVIVDGIDTSDGKMEWEIRSRVGMVFQNPDNQIIGATVEEDVAFGLENLGVPRDEMIKRIDWAASTVGIADRLKTEPHLLSGGQKQRVAIAGILAMRPDCIVLDEATAMLDPVGRSEVMKVAASLNREFGITIIHITHHMDEAVKCDRVIVMGNGAAVREGTPRELFSDPAFMRAWGLEVPGVTALAEALSERGIGIRRDILDIDEALPELVRLVSENADGAAVSHESMIGREEERAGRPGRYIYRDGPNSVEAVSISYTYGPGTPFEKKAIEDITFSVGDGEFFGIIGHTGCGKSTLVQHLNGLLKAGSGTLRIGGQEMRDANVKQLRKRVGLVFQYPEYQLFEATVAKDVAFGIRNDGLTDEETAARIDEALTLVGLDPEAVRNKSIYDLSGGQKRRVAIAGILVMKPGILVLDEPAAGLDPAGRDEILGICSRLNRDNGITVILVSHSMDDVARLCDRILVMNHGRTEMIGTPEEIFENEARLSEIGLTVPQLSGLFHRLNEALPGISISRKIYSVEDGVDEIAALLGLKNATGGESAGEATV